MSAQLDLTKPISAAMLARAGACPEAIALVRQHFGDEALPLTRARLRRAAQLGLQVSWLSGHLPLDQWRVYDAAEAEAWRVYDAAMAEALRVFCAAMDEAGRVYDAATAEPRLAFYAATADALADVLGLP